MIVKYKYFILERNSMEQCKRRNCRRQKHRKSDAENWPRSCAHEINVICLKKWMKQKAGFRNGLVPAYFSDTGRGLMTKKSISPGETIVSIPCSLLITTQTVLDSQIGQHIKRWIPKLKPQQCLAVFLIWERYSGTVSDWLPYIKLLPERFTTPAYFSSTELSFLPKETRLKALKEIEKVKSNFNEVKEFCRNNCKQLFDVLTYENFLWAWYVVNSRSVFYQSSCSDFLNPDEPDNMALAPFLDLLNHSPTANIKAGYNKDSNRYEIVTLDAYKPYEQVFISYGCHSNQKLFIEYGFCVPGNLLDDFEIHFEDVIRACTYFNVGHLPRKLDLLQSHDLMKTLSCTREGLTWKTSTVFKTLAMTWEQLQKWTSVFTDEFAFEDTRHEVNRMIKYILDKKLEENNQLLESIKVSKNVVFFKNRGRF